MGARSGGGASGGMGSGTRAQMSSAAKIANPSVKLSASDLNYKESFDEEANADLGRNDLKRWDIPNVAYKDNGVKKSTYATITQYLDNPGGKVGGYEYYFDKAYPVGSAKSLSEAKGKLLNYINSKRK